MNILFLMDPLESVNFEKDTSLALMWGAQRRGHRGFYLPESGISMTANGLHCYVQEIEATHDKDNLFIRKQWITMNENDIDSIFIRTDPPFDDEYLMNTWLLDRVSDRIVVMNNPSGIRSANEKLWAMQFPDIIPPSLISQKKTEMNDFLTHHRTVVVKPVNSYGGQGIFKLNIDDINRNVILETAMQNFTQKIIMQKFVDAADKGDKRILLLNGEPLGAILRVHAPGDHRNNIFAGGGTHPARLSSQDKTIIDRIKPELQRLGLYFVGIDILGDYLIEVNVTSPTCLQELGRFCDKTLEDSIVEFVEHLASQRSRR